MCVSNYNIVVATDDVWQSSTAAAWKGVVLHPIKSIEIAVQCRMSHTESCCKLNIHIISSTLKPKKSPMSIICNMQINDGSSLEKTYQLFYRGKKISRVNRVSQKARLESFFTLEIEKIPLINRINQSCLNKPPFHILWSSSGRLLQSHYNTINFWKRRQNIPAPK